MRKMILPIVLMALMPIQSRAVEPTAECGRRCQHELKARSFLIKLQAAVRSNNKAQVAAMTRIPLRVNRGPGKFRLYRSKQLIINNYDRIFTSKIRTAILAQDPKDISIVGTEGAMVGSGEVWFEAPCLDRFCQAEGPVSIYAINL